MSAPDVDLALRDATVRLDEQRRMTAEAEACAARAWARLRELTSRLGFGDDITEPMADNDTIVKWFEQQGRDADEWIESQRWRGDCDEKGHPQDDDCLICDPLEKAKRAARAEALRQAATDWPESGMTRAEAQQWLESRADGAS